MNALFKTLIDNGQHANCQTKSICFSPMILLLHGGLGLHWRYPKRVSTCRILVRTSINSTRTVLTLPRIRERLHELGQTFNFQGQHETMTNWILHHLDLFFCSKQLFGMHTLLKSSLDHSRLFINGQFKQKQKHPVAVFRLYFVHVKPSNRLLCHGSMVEKEETCHGRRPLLMKEKGFFVAECNKTPRPTCYAQ